jgi:hypothetical protein
MAIVNQLQKFQARFGCEMEKSQRVIDETHESVQERDRMNDGLAPIGARVDWRELEVRRCCRGDENGSETRGSDTEVRGRSEGALGLLWASSNRG